jgi:hypothetical protein
MKSHHVDLGRIGVDVPATWRDITCEVEVDEPPFTLADPSDGAGAMQFSVARYDAGPSPDPTPEVLLSMAEN